MRKLWVVILLSMVTLIGGGPAWADGFTFSLLPSSGAIDGPPGSTVGWGYTITNDSSTDYLLLTSLNTTEAFQYGTPTDLFEDTLFLLAPDQTVTGYFNATTGTGLFEFTWNSDAPLSFTNSGDFDMSGVFCTDATLTNCSMLPPDQYAAYAVTATPEPSTILLLISGVVSFWFMKKKLAHAG